MLLLLGGSRRDQPLAVKQSQISAVRWKRLTVSRNKSQTAVNV